MNYAIKKCDLGYIVEETQTHYRIKAFGTKTDASKYSKFLNSGGGFDGNTPTFFQRCVNFDTDV